MKRKLSLLLVVIMLLGVFVACDQNKKAEEPVEETPVETAEETTEEEPAEEPEEEEEEEYVPSVETVKPENVEVGPIAKIGLGNLTSTKRSADVGDNPARAQADVTIAAVAFDAEGKIVIAKVDVAQTRVNFTEDNKNADIPEGTEFKSKLELGPEYGMLKASPIGKEYDEQMNAFLEYIVGMTAEEVVNIPTRVKDEAHQNVPDVADILTSTTIDIGSYVKAIQEAWDNAVDAEGATKLGLGINTKAKGNEAKDDKPARIQIDTYMNALALDDEDKVVTNIIDVVQAKIDVDAEGKIVEIFEDVKSKKELKDDYDMRKASEIQREWFEQMADWEAFTVGKTNEEIQGIPVKVRDENHQHVPDLPELATSVTITVEGYQAVMDKAFANANN